MTIWEKYIQKDGTIPEWPYPIRYEKEMVITADVLIIGGGIGGCHAAINAAKKGVNVVIVEKAMTRRSGDAGAGVDHWQGAITNPCCKITPEEFTKAVIDAQSGFECGPLRYIHSRESWDALLDCERMGMQIRDVNDEFKGAEFRDEETKLMFAYDYENRHTLRVHGHNVKPCLHKELKRLGVKIYDRVASTSLLTEGGRQGSRVVGATGVNIRTGEFYIFKSKATILALTTPNGLWNFSTELFGSASCFGDPNSRGEGLALGWNAGAEFTMLEGSAAWYSQYSYIPYGVGNSNDTWHGCSIVDANGKEVPWVDGRGREIKSIAQRFRPAPDQKFILMSGLVGMSDEHYWSELTHDLNDRILKGEFTPPFYADLTGLPALERRAIFGLMVANESKTRTPVYGNYSRAGFDPDKDMLQSPHVPLSFPMVFPCGWAGMQVPHYRDVASAGGGMVVDWDLRTNLEGLYAGSNGIFGTGAHATAACAGRYAGRKAADYVKNATEPVLDEKQVKEEKTRVYFPLKQTNGHIGWKELNAGICRVMQDYCGQFKNEETLKTGLQTLKELRESEAAKAYAANPHELVRILECHSLITSGEMVMQASLARKASNEFLDFHRLDYPETNAPESKKFIFIRKNGDAVASRHLPFDYYLKPPYYPTFEENYDLHCGL